MGLPKVISKGQVFLPVDDGLPVAQMALTKQATQTIDGEILANLVYLAGTAKGFWNPAKAYEPVVRVNGLIGFTAGASITSVTNDNIEVPAGSANVNGVVVAFNADATNTATRPGTTDSAAYCVSVNAAGAITVTKGTDKATLDLTGGFGGAGQFPLTPANEACIGRFTATATTAAIIAAGDFYVGDSAFVAYSIDYVRGGIILESALPANYTGAIGRPIYASFRCQEASLVSIGEFESGSWAVTRERQDKTSQSRKWKQHQDIGVLGWTLKAKHLRIDSYMLGKAIDPLGGDFILKFREDKADTTYFKGYASLDGFGGSLDRGVVHEELNFTGNGELINEA